MALAARKSIRKLSFAGPRVCGNQVNVKCSPEAAGYRGDQVQKWIPMTGSEALAWTLL